MNEKTMSIEDYTSMSDEEVWFLKLMEERLKLAGKTKKKTNLTPKKKKRK